MALNSIEEIFNAFNHLKVLIIGDSMLDTYSYGFVDRMSPEAPVPIVDVTKTENRPGGAANVALNIKALGASPFLCSVVGDDIAGDTLIKLLQQAQINSSGIVKSEHRVTTVKHRVMSSGKQMIRLDTEDDHELTLSENQLLKDVIQQHISQVDLMIIEDYDKGNLHRDMIAFLEQLTYRYKVPVVVDPKFRNYQFYTKAALFKPNLKEYYTSHGVSSQNEEEIIAQVAQFREQKSHNAVLLTMSEKGMLYVGEGQALQISGRNRQIADVSGAGDTVIAIAGLCTALGIAAEIYVKLANLGGGIVCEYQGVVPIDKNQLKREAQSMNKL